MPRYALRTRRFILHNLLHADDTPHRIALGVAIATLVAFLPLIGIQTALAIGLAALFRANKAVCVPVVWITNPLTIVPIYGGCWAVGRWLMASPPEPPPAHLLELERAAADAGLLDIEWWQHQFMRLVHVGAEVWVGSIVLGTAFAIAFYFLSRRGVAIFRQRKHQRVLRRQHFRNKLRAARALGGHEPA